MDAPSGWSPAWAALAVLLPLATPLALAWAWRRRRSWADRCRACGSVDTWALDGDARRQALTRAQRAAEAGGAASFEARRCRRCGEIRVREQLAGPGYPAEE